MQKKKHLKNKKEKISMKKRMISLLLILCMTLTLLPTVTLAAEAEETPLANTEEQHQEAPETNPDAEANTPENQDVLAPQAGKTGGTAVVMSNGVAEVDGEYYPTLQAAVNAAKDNDTVKLLTDVVWAEYHAQTGKVILMNVDHKNITIDLDDHTICLGTVPEFYGDWAIVLATRDYSNVRGSFTVTLKNGTIDWVAGHTMDNRVIQGGNSGVVTLENMSITCDHQMFFGNTTPKALNIISGIYTNTADPATKKENYTAWINTSNGIASTIEISGGTFVNFDPLCQCKAVSHNVIILADGCAMTKIGNAYTVLLASSGKAKIARTVDTIGRRGDTIPHRCTYTYTTVQDAVDAIQPGDEVTELDASANPKVTITLKYNDGVSTDARIIVGKNTAITLPTPTRSGYHFDSWYTKDGTTDGYWGNEFTSTPTVDSIYYAKWSEGEGEDDLPFWLPAAIGSNPFSDVAGGAYYNEAVRWAVKYGIASGTDAKHFSPDAACTRGQAVTFLWRAAGCPAPALAENPFTDVKPTDYCYDAVLWAVQTGVAKGTSQTTFSPDAPCTRGQIVTFLYRAAGSPSGYANSGYADVPETSYCAAPVAWAVALRVTSGTSALTFSPDALCTRAQIVTFLYRANA